MRYLVLSLFPGADLFGEAFEREGFCVVRGPELILGAIHLLNRLGSIDCVMLVKAEDVPIMTGTPDNEVLSLYADLENIIEYIDGDLTINSIAKAMDLEPSVLIAVFTELHKRGIITFKE